MSISLTAFIPKHSYHGTGIYSSDLEIWTLEVQGISYSMGIHVCILHHCTFELNVL